MSMSMNVHKELPSAQKMQLALIHLVHTSAAATMVIMEMASLVMVSNYFVLTLFYLLNLISDYFISYVFTGVSVSSSGFNYLSFELSIVPQKCQRLTFLELQTYGLLTKCEVKMAGYWPSSFFACLWTEKKGRSINSQKKNEANIQPSWPNKLGQ